jgi:hypothetical protein
MKMHCFVCTSSFPSIDRLEHTAVHARSRAVCEFFGGPPSLPCVRGIPVLYAGDRHTPSECADVVSCFTYYSLYNMYESSAKTNRSVAHAVRCHVGTHSRVLY